MERPLSATDEDEKAEEKDSCLGLVWSGRKLPCVVSLMLLAAKLDGANMSLAVQSPQERTRMLACP